MNALETGKWATVIPFERYTKRKSRTDIVSPSLTRIARWLRSWRYEVLERTGQPEANETRFLLFLPPLEAAVALSYLALPCLVLPRLTLSALLRPVLSYLALSCLVVPATSSYAIIVVVRHLTLCNIWRHSTCRVDRSNSVTNENIIHIIAILSKNLDIEQVKIIVNYVTNNYHLNMIYNKIIKYLC